METTEVEKSVAACADEASQLNRNRSFKSKQLVRSQAIRETHSPPRALSPAQTPKVTIFATAVATSTPCVGNSSPGVGNSSPSVGNTEPSVDNTTSDVDNATTNIENGIDDVGNTATKIPTSRGEENSPPSAGISPPSVENSPPNVENTGATAEKASNERSVSDDSSHVSVRCSDVKYSDSDDFKKKLPVEIQITSGGWDDSYHERYRARRWHSDAPRDLLSNNPRVSCVCGYCAACVHCRGRRRRPYYTTKQDSGIVCPDDCPDNSDNDSGATNNDTMRKSSSLDVDDQPYYCRCPERKETRPRMLTRYDSDDRYEPTGPELVNFIKDTLNKNGRDRAALLKIERELHALVNDSGRCIVRFPVMTSYGRMLVHRCAALFQLAHHLDMTNKTSVLVSKSGTSGGRIPCTSFREWCTATFPPSPLRHQPDPPPHAKSILKRDTHSLDEPGAGSLANNRSKSLEQREREYEKVRRRIFSSQDETQWPWLATGPIRLLTPEAGGRNKLLKVQSLEGSGPGSTGSWRGARGPVSKSHSFGGYAAAEPHTPRLLSRQGDLASSSWRLSPSSSGYKTLSLRSTDSITPSPTGGASPEPAVSANIPVTSNVEPAGVVWCVTDMSAVPPGAMVIHPHTGRPLTNPDGTVYQFDPANPPVLFDPSVVQTEQQKLDPASEKRRGRLEKQHSFIDNEIECQPNEECRGKCCCDCRREEGCQLKSTAEKVHIEETITKPPSPFEPNTQINAQEETKQQLPEFEEPTNGQPEQYEVPNQQLDQYEVPNQQLDQYEVPNQQLDQYEVPNQQLDQYEVPNQQLEQYEVPNQQLDQYKVPNQQTEQYEMANQQPEQYEMPNHQPEQYEMPNHQPEQYAMPNQTPEQYEVPNQQPVYEQPTNEKPYEPPRSFEPANQSAVNNGYNNRHVKLANDGHEVQYQTYHTQGYRTEVASPIQMVNHYAHHEVNMQVMSQQKVTQLPLPDPNIRQMPLTNMTNMVYQAPMTQGGYNPYQCRVEPSLQMYPQVLQTDEHKLAPSPHSNETAFRIDPSYPYAAVDYTAATCGACVDTNSMQNMQQHQHQHQQRSYSVPYGQMEVSQTVLPQYPVGNVLLQQPHVQQMSAYPQYQEQLPWAVPSHGLAPQKLMLPELYPIMQYQQPTYQHYNIVYPQVIQQPYPICQPVYPVIDKQADQSRNNLSNRPSNRNSISGSARATPSVEEKVTYEDGTRQNSEIAAKIQQIKSQMAHLDTRDYRFDKDRRGEWRRRNSGNGLLGNCPVNNFNGRIIPGRGPHDDKHLTTAARAIVDTIRNMQAKTTYHDNRRDYQRYDNKYDRPDRPEYRRRDRDDYKEKDMPRTSDGHTERYDPRNRGLNVPVFRQPYLFRQMAPGTTWCRRSPAPVHPVLSHPRRPHPDTRHPRR